jgi:hypothetical protein
MISWAVTSLVDTLRLNNDQQKSKVAPGVLLLTRPSQDDSPTRIGHSQAPAKAL